MKKTKTRFTLMHFLMIMMSLTVVFAIASVLVHHNTAHFTINSDTKAFFKELFFAV